MGSTWQSTPAPQDYEAAESMLQHSRAGRNVQFPPLNGYQPSDPSNYVQQPSLSLRHPAVGPAASYSPPSVPFPPPPGPSITHPTPPFGAAAHTNLLPPPDSRRAGADLSLPKIYRHSHTQQSPSQSQALPDLAPSIGERHSRNHHVENAPSAVAADLRGQEEGREQYWGSQLDGDIDENASVKEELEDPDERPAWASEKTKAGKERKRLPLACIACRRKKIRCSGEKPACRHCVRAKMPCVYKITTRKAAPRTDYIAMLDRRLKRMEERIIRMAPKTANHERKVSRAVLRPAVSKDGHRSTKRDADEAFDTQVEDWVKSKPHPHSFQSQKLEEDGIYRDGADQLPSKEIQSHLSEVFFDYVYGQSYHIMHQPSYMRKLHLGQLPPVLILAVCAIAARFSNHPEIETEPEYLRGEEWATPARRIVLKRYDEPNILILTVSIILGLHEFGTCQGGRSWMFAGMAIRMAHALQLHRELDHDPAGKETGQQAEFNYTDREVRRRVMWACFMMDRFTASGTERPMYMDENDIKVHLPINETKFNAELSGPTGTLSGQSYEPAASVAEQPLDTKNNMGVAAYMVRAIALWGRVIKYENLGGKEKDTHPMWAPQSQFQALRKQVLDFKQGLPSSLRYTQENLQTHASVKTGNQLIFLHVALSQIILFLHRFAIPTSHSARPPQDMPKDFYHQAFRIAIDTATQIAKLLSNALDYRVVAPFMGYCAFTSSTVLAWAVFFGNPASQALFYQSLAQNLHYLRSLKKYWGVLHFMAKNLREIYARHKEVARSGETESLKGTGSIHQYGDWFDKFPRGVSRPGEDQAKPNDDTKFDLDDEIPQAHQNSDKRSVEDFFDSLGGPRKVITSQSKRLRKAPKTSAPSSRRHSQTANKTGANATPDNKYRSEASNAPVAEPVRHITTPFAVPPQEYPPPQPNYQVSFEQGAFEQPGNTSLIPQLDRQIVFGAYNGHDPTSSTASMNLDAMPTATSPPHYTQPSNGEMWNGPAQIELDGGQNIIMSPGDEYLGGDYNSTAWFMPFNLQPPPDGGNYGGER